MGIEFLKQVLCIQINLLWCNLQVIEVMYIFTKMKNEALAIGYNFCKKIVVMLVLLTLSIIVDGKGFSNLNQKNGWSFLENKGQISDQFGNKRPDIQYYFASKGVFVYIGDNQIHYQFATINNIDSDNLVSRQVTSEGQKECSALEADSKDQGSFYNTYRLDVVLVGANLNHEIEEIGQKQYYENYYTQGCPADGIKVRSFSKITYRNVYPDIDWVLYNNGGNLEYEFNIGPNGDASKIKLKYLGATSLKLDDAGNLVATTPMGKIKEHKPVCYRAGQSQKDIVPSVFRLEGDELTYDLSINSGLVIDPAIEWGTYYGDDSSVTITYALTTDAAPNVYAAGYTYSLGHIATSGAFQNTSGGDIDAFLAKFDTLGNLIWATYYGNIGGDWAKGVSCDQVGNVYLGGSTSSHTGISTPGCQQPTYGGGSYNGFLVKFNSAGARQWCTYLGGNNVTQPSSVCTDKHGHVYVTGLSDDSYNISTPGSCQPTHSGGHDLFLIQYDTLGVRRWGTYYGGSSDEFGGDISSDGTYLYFIGWTSSTNNIATAGSYQPTKSGGSDAFLVKFDTTGHRIWGTYYGGPSTEKTGGIVANTLNHIYLLGSTTSDAGIVTPGCYQPTRGGSQDAFVAKFDTSGHPIWATYYGGPDVENVDNSRIACDNNDDVFVTGFTASTTGIPCPGVWQTVYGGGGQDAFVAKYDRHGIQLWSSYLGGNDVDEAFACTSDGANVYVAGTTHSTNNIATPGGYIPTGGGLAFYNQGFVVKISDFMPSVDVAKEAGGVSNLILFPSPNSGNFTVSGQVSGSDNLIKIVICNILGEVVFQKEAGIHESYISESINLESGLPNGTYFLKLLNSTGVSTCQFMKVN